MSLVVTVKRPHIPLLQHFEDPEAVLAVFVIARMVIRLELLSVLPQSSQNLFDDSASIVALALV